VLVFYLLIGFTKPRFNDAAKKAFIMNRIGDLGTNWDFHYWIIILTLDYATLKTAIAGATDLNMLDSLLPLCFIHGACGKSAQIPLYTWLPDAMAGLTPVSALIHAAMVTAGIFMITRLNLFDLSDVQTSLPLSVTSLVGNYCIGSN
jgi:NADH-quinone oxidoreductase subunit L